jgi:hypothetical protein
MQPARPLHQRSANIVTFAAAGVVFARSEQRDENIVLPPRASCSVTSGFSRDRRERAVQR